MANDQEIGHPIAREKYDLSQDPCEIRRDGGKAPNMLHGQQAEARSPYDMMRSMGFDVTYKITPLQFLIAVMNDDLDIIFRNETRRKKMEAKGGIGLSYRLEAAKTAAKYLHQELPKVLLTDDKNNGKFGDGLTKALAEGNERIRTRRVIMEQIEHISPDVALEPASYPPALQEAIIREGLDDDDAE